MPQPPTTATNAGDIIVTEEGEVIIVNDAGTGERGKGPKGPGPFKNQPASPPPSDEDISLLIRLLTGIRNELLLFLEDEKRIKVFPGEWREKCRSLWPEMNTRFESVLSQLKSPSQSMWNDFVLAGLTGEMLKFKVERVEMYIAGFGRAIQKYSLLNPEEQESSKGILTLLRDVLFDSMNSILGSFLRAFHVLEAVKEYKDHVHLSIKAQEVLEGDLAS